MGHEPEPSRHRHQPPRARGPASTLPSSIRRLSASERHATKPPIDNPANLATALSLEIAELEEIFLWSHLNQVQEIVFKERDEDQEKIAGIAISLLLLCHILNMDLGGCTN